MTALRFDDIDGINASAGGDYGDWGPEIEVSQDKINQFAELTGDHQWIHVDIERANAGPFGSPIAHGFLTLSLLPALKPAPTKPTFWKSIAATVGGEAQMEKAQLEAFLSATPWENCGFTANGQVAYSPGFASLLNLREIRTIDDIQTALSASDAAALEGLFERLRESGESFTLSARTTDRSRAVKITGPG